MRTLFIILFFISSLSYGQKNSKNDSITQAILNSDSLKLPAKWPYIKNRTPEFIGALVGYNFYADQNFEIGAIMNIADADGVPGAVVGSIVGPSLSYKRYLLKNVNSINFDLGIYDYIAIGLGTNYTFSDEGESFWGFKPFIGLSVFHFQLTYGYNFFSEKNNRDMQLGHHNVTLRLAIPLSLIDKQDK